MAEGGDRKEEDLSNLQISSEQLEASGPSSSSSQVKSSAYGVGNKKQKTTITDITHISLEKLKKSMDRHTYQVHVIDENFFNGPRDLEASFEMIVKEVLNEVLRDIEYDRTYMRVAINFTFDYDQSTDKKYYVNISYNDIADDVAVTEIMRRLEGSFQSGDKATFFDFNVVATGFKLAKGNGKVPNKLKNTNLLEPRNVSFDHSHINKVQIQNGPVGCAFKAVVLFRKLSDKSVKPRGIKSKTIERAAKKLAEKCHLEYTDPFIVTDFQTIENVEKCRIFVFAPDDQGVKILYNPSNENRNDPLYIIGHDEDDHYYAIPEDKLKFCFENTMKKGTYRNGIFCTHCYIFSSNNVSHKLDCEHYGCRQCLDVKCHGSLNHKGVFKKCSGCNREFYNTSCYKKHKVNTTCKKIKICLLCLTQIKVDRKGQFQHDCKQAYCKACSTSYIPTENEYHICYMKKKKNKKKNCKVFTCYYDIETYEKEKGNNDRGRRIIEMIPYLLVCQMICNLCSNKEDNNECSHCGPRTRIFKLEDEKDPVDQFVEFLMKFSSKKSKDKVIVAAHNGGKFDHQYVYASLLTHNNSKSISSNPIKRGNKIISMGSNENIVFRDTLLFTPCSLKNMPKCMGVNENGLSKGFFPYTFLKENSLNYKGPIPDKTYFNVERMSAGERQDFEEYYNSFKDKEYDIFEECQKYCVQDVNVLRKCFEKFRTNFINDFDIDCLADCSTIASLCFSIYKNKFMPEDKITILGRDNPKPFTFEAIRWLMYQEKEKDINIRHARNGGEKSFKIKNNWLYPDGFGYVEGVKTVFLYHGCAWHGHKDCNNGQGTLFGISPVDRYTLVKQQEARYKEEGFKVVTIWDCEWKKKKEEIIQDPDNTDKYISVGKYVQRISNDAVNNRLTIDKSLFGGRTEPFVHYYPPTKGKKIIYLDYTSLYPFVQKRMKYPCGPPEKLIGDKVPDIESFKNGLNDKYFGIAYVKILPPQNLDIPVLAERIEKKLMFPLCVKCAKVGCEKCTHMEKERAIDGVYTTPEIQLAFDMGYKLLKIFEVWSFKEQEFLFEEYVNYFLKIKTEASGPPSNIHENDPDFRRKLKEFIRLFKEKEGVELDIDNIKKNPGMRFIAKLCLNSLWGKFAQNTPNREVVICTSDKQVWELINKSDIEVSFVTPIGNKYVVTIVKNALAERSSSVTNIPIASFTTAYARIKLYELLNKVKHRALYCDTDSCIFVAGENDEVPETGNFLGELTDELSEFGEGAYGESFVCTGPKSYAVKIRTTDGNIKHIVKAKGLTINENTKDIINFERLLKLVVKGCSENNTSHEESLYENIKHEDVTVKAMHDFQLDDNENADEDLPHKKAARIDESQNSNVDLKGSYRGGLCYQVQSETFQPGKYGGVSFITGMKKMQLTSNKRIFIKNSFRTVPFGFKGSLKPL